MYINVAHILKESVGSNKNYRINEPTGKAGICPSYGHNLNQVFCQCSKHISDGRLAKLRCVGKENEV